MARLVITGASGFIGRHAVAELCTREFEIHALLRKPWQGAPAAVTQHLVDLNDTAALNRAMCEIAPSRLLHLAWDVTPGCFWSAPANLDWVAMSLHLYRAFATAGGRRLVVAGSCAEYAWSRPLLDEMRTPLAPHSLYGAAKHGLHGILESAAEQAGLELAWARIFIPYGPYENKSRLVPSVACALLQGREIACGDGQIERDMIHAADAGAALCAILESSYTGPVNIASGQCVKLRDVIGKIGALIGRPELIRYAARPKAPDEPPKLAAATAILHDRLGFRPRFTLDDGLADAVNWWRAALWREART
ncbi:MAG: NAD(P)-dependent oxidoreductase [Rhodospirillales bacterium]|nr:NAD(P)-dependent oxidoreductase [Rhodospirillales bacterium]